jgi:hypothetical protein
LASTIDLIEKLARESRWLPRNWLPKPHGLPVSFA